jgi:hypothetical protein
VQIEDEVILAEMVGWITAPGSARAIAAFPAVDHGLEVMRELETRVPCDSIIRSPGMWSWKRSGREIKLIIARRGYRGQRVDRLFMHSEVDEQTRAALIPCATPGIPSKPKFLLADQS